MRVLIVVLALIALVMSSTVLPIMLGKRVQSHAGRWDAFRAGRLDRVALPAAERCIWTALFALVWTTWTLGFDLALFGTRHLLARIVVWVLAGVAFGVGTYFLRSSPAEQQRDRDRAEQRRQHPETGSTSPLGVVPTNRYRRTR